MRHLLRLKAKKKENERTKQSAAKVCQLLLRGLECGRDWNGSAAFFNVISCNCFACERALRLIKLATWHSFDSIRIRGNCLKLVGKAN